MRHLHHEKSANQPINHDDADEGERERASTHSRIVVPVEFLLLIGQEYRIGCTVGPNTNDNQASDDLAAPSVPSKHWVNCEECTAPAVLLQKLLALRSGSWWLDFVLLVEHAYANGSKLPLHVKRPELSFPRGWGVSAPGRRVGLQLDPRSGLFAVIQSG